MAIAASSTISPTQKLTTIRIRPTTPTAMAIFVKRDTVCLLLRGKTLLCAPPDAFPHPGLSTSTPDNLPVVRLPRHVAPAVMPRRFAPWTRRGGPPGRPGWCVCTGGIHDALAAHRRRRQRAADAQPAGAAARHAARPAGD